MSVQHTNIQGDVSISRNLNVGVDVKVEGSMTVDHDLRVEGWVDARNIRGAFKGLFSSEEALNTAYPRPMPGWYAYTGSGIAKQVWHSEGGQWVLKGYVENVVTGSGDYFMLDGSDIHVGYADNAEEAGHAVEADHSQSSYTLDADSPVWDEMNKIAGKVVSESDLSNLDEKYVKIPGDTMTGPLRITQLGEEHGGHLLLGNSDGNSVSESMDGRLSITGKSGMVFDTDRKGLTLDGIPIRIRTDGALEFGCTIVATGDIVAFAAAEGGDYSGIYAGLPIDAETLAWNAAKHKTGLNPCFHEKLYVPLQQ